MLTSLNAKEINAAAERVCASRAFAGAARLQRLLRFLTDASLASEPVKETVIGVRVFDREPGYDPQADSVVRTEVRRLRLKLADYYASEGAADPIRIEIPRGAYIARFDAAASSPAAPSRAWARRRRLRVVAISCAATIMGIVAAVKLPHRPSAPAGETIAVLPFVSEDPRQAELAGALSDSVTADLSRTHGLRVISPSSAARAGSHPDRAAAVLNARYLVTAGISRDGGPIRVSVLSEPAGAVLAQSDYRENTPELADRIVHDVLHSLGGQSPIALPHTRTHVARAEELFVEGRRLWGDRDPADLRKAAGLFRQASALDPDYVWPYVGLADAYGVLVANLSEESDNLLPKAEAAARHAVSLSPELADAHASLGLVLYCKWDWTGADHEYRTARTLNPNLSIALFRSALISSAFGRFDEALQTLHQAAAIDPLSLFVPGAIAEVEFYKRDYPAAVAAAEELRKHDREQSFTFLWRPLFAEGKREESRRIVSEWKAVAGMPLMARVAELFLLYREHPEQARAQYYRLLAEYPQSFSHVTRAYGFATLGEKEAALAELRESLRLRETDLVSAQWDPSLDSLRSDPRFQAIMSQLPGQPLVLRAAR